MNRRSLSIIRSAVAASALVVVLGACGAAPLPVMPRDPSGNLLFDYQDVRHGAGLPYLCFDGQVDGNLTSPCYLTQDECEQKMKKLVRDPGWIIKSAACAPSEDMFCHESYQRWNISSRVSFGAEFTVVVGQNVPLGCYRTLAYCEADRQNDLNAHRDKQRVDLGAEPSGHEQYKNFDPMTPKDVSACVHLDKNFQPPQ